MRLKNLISLSGNEIKSHFKSGNEIKKIKKGVDKAWVLHHFDIIISYKVRNYSGSKIQIF